MFQRDRVFLALQRKPITQMDFIAPTCDGGSQIFRVADRIEELRKKGHRISTTITEYGVAQYALQHLDGQTVEQDSRTTAGEHPEGASPTVPAVVPGSPAGVSVPVAVDAPPPAGSLLSPAGSPLFNTDDFLPRTDHYLEEAS